MKIVFGGRGKGKMMALNKFIELLPKELREKVIVIRSTPQKEGLRGNNIRRTVWND